MQLATLQSDKDESESKQLNNAEQTIQRLESEQAELKSANDELTRHLEAQRMELQELREVSSANLHALEDDQHQLSDERDRLQNQLTELQTELAEKLASQPQALELAVQESLSEHQQTTEQLQEQVEGLRQQLESERAASSSANQQALETVEQARNEVVKERNALAGQVDDLSQQLREAQEQLAVVHNQPDPMVDVKAHEAAQKAQEEAQTQIAELNAELVALKAQTVDAAEAAALRVNISELEDKLADQSSSSSDQNQDGGETSTDVEAGKLQERNRELELLLRDRTEELNDARWRLEQAAQNKDENLVLILNQQLKDVRDELERLQSKTATSSAASSKDFTLLRGVGEKLAEQLLDAGIESIRQIAELKSVDLEDPGHPLHQFHARLVRDDWIGQAQELCS